MPAANTPLYAGRAPLNLIDTMAAMPQFAARSNIVSHCKELRLVRVTELCGNRKANPPTPRMLPFSPATLWRKVKAGDFPQPIRVSPGITAWSLAEIETWLSSKPVGAAGRTHLKNGRAAA